MDCNNKRVIEKLHWRQTATGRFGDEYSKFFPITRSMRQGCVISPKLFNFYTENIFNESDDFPGCIAGGENIINIRCADDTAQLSESEKTYGVYSISECGLLKLSACINNGLLTTHVIEGRRLNCTHTGQPDSFVVISVIPEDDSLKPAHCRTSVVRNSSSPKYHEKFSLDVGNDCLKKRLLVTAWHKDSNTGVQESLGCTSFGLHLLQHENHCVSGWYHLLTEEIGCRKHFKVPRRTIPAVPVILSHDVASILSINQDIHGLEIFKFTMHRYGHGGFGFSVIDGCPAKVGHVDCGSCAEEAGLQKGDFVIHVNGQNVSRSTAVSVASCIKSGSILHIEIGRNYVFTPQKSSSINTYEIDSDRSNEVGVNSVLVYTLCDDHLYVPSFCAKTRRQAAFHRLLSLEENFVDRMNFGIYEYSRPLRHCLLSSSQHAVLFQNIEKIACMSEYQVHQIINNLPLSSPSSIDMDTSIVGASELLESIAGIYLSKLSVLIQAYSTYIAGVPRAANILAQLEVMDDFRRFVLSLPIEGRQMQLREFINCPIKHVQDLYGVMVVICDTTISNSRQHAMFKHISTDLQTVVDKIRQNDYITSSLSLVWPSQCRNYP